MLPQELQEEEEARSSLTRRRVRITHKDILTFGPSPNCPRCACHQRGAHRRARFHKHAEACRARICSRLREAGADKVEFADAERTQTFEDVVQLPSEAPSAATASHQHGPTPQGPSPE